MHLPCKCRVPLSVDLPSGNREPEGGARLINNNIAVLEVLIVIDFQVKVFNPKIRFSAANRGAIVMQKKLDDCLPEDKMILLTNEVFDSIYSPLSFLRRL